MCQNCDPTASTQSGDIGIGNAEAMIDRLTTYTMSQVNDAGEIALPVNLMVGLASINSQLSTAKELRQIRKLLEMMVAHQTGLPTELFTMSLDTLTEPVTRPDDEAGE